MSAVAIQPSTPQPFTVTLGLHKGPAEYRAALEHGGFIVEHEADLVMDRIHSSAEQLDLELVPLSLTDLGVSSATYDEICRLGVAKGLELCPAEAAPALRLQYPDQPMEDLLYLAMEARPIRKKFENEMDHFLGVTAYEGKRYLAAEPKWLKFYFDNWCSFLFVQPTPPSRLLP